MSKRFGRDAGENDLMPGRRYTHCKFSQDEVESWTTAHTIAVGAALLPAAFQPRLKRLIAEITPSYDPHPSAIGRRDNLLREHDRRFSAPSHSLTKRAMLIEGDLRRAQELTVPASDRMVSAQVILIVSGGKTLKYRRIMDIIRSL